MAAAARFLGDDDTSRNGLHANALIFKKRYPPEMKVPVLERPSLRDQ